MLSLSTINFSPAFGAAVPLPVVLDAAAAAGFTQVGLDLWSVDAHLRGSEDFAGLGALLADRNLTCSDVLPLAVTGDDTEVLATATRLARLAAAVGAPTCGTAVLPGGPDPGSDRLRALLDRCCAVLADAGARLALEFLPYSPLSGVAEARELCTELGFRRAGLLVDSWHTLVTGQLAEVGGLPAEAIAMVQFSDGIEPPSRDVGSDSRNRRLLPGEGNLDLEAFARAVQRTGFDGTISAEVLSTRVREGSPFGFAEDVRRRMARTWSCGK